ncbi:MAG: WXG100 family type VII secretion target [Actinomycetota bacterium]|nr:WXG100 family type VII secretion target [Actinomycetota bacterium]
MSGFKVTPEQLHQLSGRTTSTAAGIEADTRSLEGALQPLFGADWTGQAQAEFQRLWEDWHRNARGMNEALEGIAALLRNAGDAYQQAEEAVASSFRR